MNVNKSSWTKVLILSGIYLFGLFYSVYMNGIYDKSYVTAGGLYIVFITPVYALLNGLFVCSDTELMVAQHVPFIIIISIIPFIDTSAFPNPFDYYCSLWLILLFISVIVSIIKHYINIIKHYIKKNRQNSEQISQDSDENT